MYESCKWSSLTLTAGLALVCLTLSGASADPMGAAAAGLMAPPPGLPGGMIPALPGLGRPPAYGLFGPTGQHLSASVLGLDFLPPPEVLAAQMREQQMREQEPQPAGGLLHQAPLWSDMEEAESPWQQQQPPLEGPHANGGMRSSTGGGSSRPGVAGGYNVIQHQVRLLPGVSHSSTAHRSGNMYACTLSDLIRHSHINEIAGSTLRRCTDLCLSCGSLRQDAFCAGGPSSICGRTSAGRGANTALCAGHARPNSSG